MINFPLSGELPVYHAKVLHMRKSLLVASSLAILLAGCEAISTTASQLEAAAPAVTPSSALPGGFELIETVERTGDEIASKFPNPQNQPFLNL